MAGAPFGFGMVVIFLAVMNYLIDAYTIFAASVLAASSVLRSLFGFAFPLFTKYMYSNLGIHWASSVPAFLALACVPAPFLLLRYGESIRMSCPYARKSEEIMASMRTGSEERDEVVERRHSGGSVDEESVVSHVEEMPRMKKSVTTASKISISTAAAVRYDASPYDIDRVHTKESLSELA